MKKIKINAFSRSYWYVPSIWTMSKRKWAPRGFPQLKPLLEREGLLDGNYIIDLNGDKDHKHLKLFMEWKQWARRFKKEDFQKLLNKELVIWKFPEFYLVWDYTSYQYLKNGYLPFVDWKYISELQQFSNNYSQCLTWKFFGFQECSKKAEEKLQKILNSTQENKEEIF